MIGQSALQLALNQQWQTLRSKNPRYSLRSYAGRLCLSPGALSAILSGKRRISNRLALRILDRMNLSPGERASIETQFVSSVHPGSPFVRPLNQELVLQDDQFKLISDGLHFSLLSLLETKKCRSDVAWLSHRLNATQKQVERCLSRLHRLNLIKSKDGKKWQVTGAEVKTTDHVASLAIRRYHEDRFEEAKEKINKVPLELRDFNSVTIAVNAAKLREAKLLIREFKERIKELLSKGEKDEVYRFNIQLYPVTEINQFEEKK